jgi:hypothetical protein
MTGPVKEVDKAGSIERRKSPKEKVWNRAEYTGDKEQDDADDSVLISEEARKRASGKHRKTILEHIAESED